MLQKLSYKELYRHCSLKSLSMHSTKELDNYADVIGQDKAIEAISFAMNMKEDGYNVFCLGREGIGKKSLALQLLGKFAAEKKAPDDWCYVNNFDFSHKPRAVRLPTGKARTFAKDVQKFIKDAELVLPGIFEGNRYNKRVHEIEEQFREEKERYFESLQSLAKGKKNVVILRMASGLVVTPTKDGEVLTPEKFDKLSKETRRRILNELTTTQEALEAAVKEVPKWEKEQKEQVALLNQKITDEAVQGLLSDLMKKYATIPDAKRYLTDMSKDIVENVAMFLDDTENPEEDALANFIKRSKKSTLILNRYKVNVFTTHSGAKGAPVIYLEHPALPNLVGRLERMQQFGALITDFSLIKPGALHQANGGYLIIDARDICCHPAAWEALKRSLSSKKIHIESVEEESGVISSTTLEPEPIPLDIKIVLIGDNELYYALSETDIDFHRLFKVEANFYPRVERNSENISKYASLIATLGRKYKLKPFSKPAVERLIEYASRIAHDISKLTTRLSAITDLMKEADYFARIENSHLIEKKHIIEALDAKVSRSDNIYRRNLELIEEGTILINTSSKEIGQINILAVQEYGHIAFGHPSRLTCQTHLGKGDIIDIEREVDLGGPIHTKGIFILKSYLASKFAAEEKLSINASIAVEQSYGPIDGDSASAAELYALLSSIAKAPINQGFAITGAVNQLGQIQAIGAVNEKIEGFFDVCKMKGLTGKQGVLIPKSNVNHLMLKEEVVKAVKDGLFNVYALENISDGVEILMDMPAGELKNGKYPKNSLFGKVAERLHYSHQLLKDAKK